MNRPISSANDGQTATRKLAVHTITTKPLGLAEAVAEYSRRGVGGISVWLDAIAGMPISEARRVISDGGLKVPALGRRFLPSVSRRFLAARLVSDFRARSRCW